MPTIIDHTILAKTRAEEHDADVWGKFFIPPYFSRLDLKNATKSTYIVGKRGCGKTMLLKYLDYHTAFSPKREAIPEKELSHIGIYWRVDTQFCNSLKLRGVKEEEWITIFESYFSLVISVEIIRSIQAIAASAFAGYTLNDFSKLRFNSAPDFHPDFPSSPKELESFLESCRRRFTTWISNIASMSQPLLPPGRAFIDALIEDIKATAGLREACFYVYVDEVENLVPYQRKVLNSFLKHSQKPFIVSFTSKELSNESATTGPESVNATHDFRLLDLDRFLSETDRHIFFAEVYLANLDIAAQRTESKILEAVLSPANLPSRQNAAYKEKVLQSIRTRFPGKTTKELAEDALQQPRIMRILQEKIEKALNKRGSALKAEDFMKFKASAEALVIVPALLNRPRLSPEEVLSQIEKYALNGDSSFSTTWVHNNLVGALLELYRPYSSLAGCPLYSGFDTFCTMANNNLRHFLILGYKALEIAELKNENADVFSIETQAEAAYEAADKLVAEIKTFGELGERLRIFVLRLGGIFRALQAQLPMSEPEQNQFTINSGDRAFDSEELKFLNEATKYAILIEQLETKTKNAIGMDIVDYQLNPMYAPYFTISYRRKRKIEISVEEFGTIALGTENDYHTLSARFTKREQSATESQQIGLWQ